MTGTGKGLTAIVVSMVIATMLALIGVALALVMRIDLPARTAHRSAAEEPPIIAAPVPDHGRPVAIGGGATWFTADDYPVEALRRGEQGRVKVRLAVDRRGRPTACAIIETSGSPALDVGTCRTFLARARFRRGRPGSIDMAAVRWVLP
jgi:TonB family protein